MIESAPLQAYASALIFSPVNCVTRKTFEKEEPEWIKVKPIVENAWSGCLQTLEGHKGSVCSVAFSHDSKLLASGPDSDRIIKIWDAATGSLQQTLKGHRDSVLSVVFSYNSKLLASISTDYTIKIWDAETGSLQHTLNSNRFIWSVAFSHDSKLLASGSGDKSIEIWDVATGSLQQTLDFGTKIRTISFDDTSSYLDTEIGRIKLADRTQTPTRIQALPQTPHLDQDQKAKCCGYGLNRDKSWITWNGHNVLWLPPGYRSRASAISSFTLPSTLSTVVTKAFGCISGRVFLIGFSNSGPSSAQKGGLYR